MSTKSGRRPLRRKGISAILCPAPTREPEGERLVIRLIASDIDGTLMPYGQTGISEDAFRQIERLADKGVMFCPASGRQYKSLRALFAPVADKLYYMCENGAVLFGPGDPATVLAKTAMERTEAVALCRAIVAHPDCEVLISGQNTSYLCPKQEDMVVLIRDFVGNDVVLVKDPGDVPEDIVKIAAFCRRGAAAEVDGPLSKWGKVFSMAVAGAPWLDFTLADKGLGLNKLCAAVGIKPEEVLAFGDNFNDVPLLKAAGTAYIMAGADPALLKMFPNHCQRVEEVLAAL